MNTNMLRRFDITVNENTQEYFVNIPKDIIENWKITKNDKLEYIWVSDSGNGAPGVCILRKASN